ncbi:MAG TPA: FHA domain-containing protein [Oligoflexia bacterium]|nr:FHA domain-containing protein [Oligoflexia bacterium]HMR24180.1 FHA domain-containing protein [Oligoflexia bacterium]
MAKISKISPVVADRKAVFLRLYNQGKFIETFQLKKGSTLVGRDPSNQIVIKSTFVSRHHFVIEVLDSGIVYIQDLKSRNGTYVNRERISKIKLTHKDRVICGPFEFIFNQPHFDADKDNPDSLTALDVTQKDAAGKRKREPKNPNKKPSLGQDGSGVSLSIEYLDHNDLDIPTIITGLESSRGTNATREADMSVFPDRVVPLQRTSKTKIFLMALAMVSVSAVLAYGMFIFLQKNASKSQLVMQEANDTDSQEESTATVDVKNSNQTNSNKQKVKTKPKGNTVAKSNKSQKSSKNTNFKVADVLGNIVDEEIDFSGLSNLSENTSQRRKNIAKAISKATLSVDVEPPKHKGSLFSFSKNKNKEVSVDSAKEALNYQRSIKNQLGFVQNCFVNYAKNPERPGVISLEISLNDAGRVNRERIDSDHFKTSQLDQCLKKGTEDIIADSKPPWEGFTASYKFKFAGVQKKSFDS